MLCRLPISACGSGVACFRLCWVELDGRGHQKHLLELGVQVVEVVLFALWLTSLLWMQIALALPLMFFLPWRFFSLLLSVGTEQMPLLSLCPSALSPSWPPISILPRAPSSPLPPTQDPWAYMAPECATWGFIFGGHPLHHCPLATGCACGDLVLHHMGALFFGGCSHAPYDRLFCPWTSLVIQLVKNLPAMQEIWVQSLVWEDPLLKGMAIHSSILAWGIPWTEESGRLQSMGLQGVGYNWETNTFTYFYCPWLGYPEASPLISGCGLSVQSSVTTSAPSEAPPPPHGSGQAPPPQRPPSHTHYASAWPTLENPFFFSWPPCSVPRATCFIP